MEDLDLSPPVISRHQSRSDHRRHGLTTDCLAFQYDITNPAQSSQVFPNSLQII